MAHHKMTKTVGLLKITRKASSRRFMNRGDPVCGMVLQHPLAPSEQSAAGCGVGRVKGIDYSEPNALWNDKKPVELMQAFPKRPIRPIRRSSPFGHLPARFSLWNWPLPMFMPRGPIYRTFPQALSRQDTYSRAVPSPLNPLN